MLPSSGGSSSTRPASLAAPRELADAPLRAGAVAGRWWSRAVVRPVEDRAAAAGAAFVAADPAGPPWCGFSRAAGASPCRASDDAVSCHFSRPRVPDVMLRSRTASECVDFVVACRWGVGALHGGAAATAVPLKLGASVGALVGVALAAPSGMNSLRSRGGGPNSDFTIRIAQGRKAEYRLRQSTLIVCGRILGKTEKHDEPQYVFFLRIF